MLGIEKMSAGNNPTDITTVGYVWGGIKTYDDPLQIGITDDDDTQDWNGNETGNQAHLTVNGGTIGTVWGGGEREVEFTTEDGVHHTENMLLVITVAAGS